MKGKKNWISLLGLSSLAEGKVKPRAVEDVSRSHENHSIKNIKNESVHGVKNRKKKEAVGQCRQCFSGAWPA